MQEEQPDDLEELKQEILVFVSAVEDMLKSIGELEATPPWEFSSCGFCRYNNSEKEIPGERELLKKYAGRLNISDKESN